MKVAAAKDRVAKLEIAMAAMEGMEGPEVESHSQPKNSPVVKTSGMRPFGNPQVRVTAAQEKVAKLEAALAALHSVDGPKIECLRAALKRAKVSCRRPAHIWQSWMRSAPQ